MPPSAAQPVWWLRAEADGVVTLRALASPERVDGAVVEVATLPPGHVPRGERVIRARMRPGTRQMLSVEVTGSMRGAAPDVVLLEQVRRDARPVEVHLLAFLHDDVVRAARARSLAPVDPGTVLTAADARRLGLAATDQLAAVRWEAATGRVLEIYVDPAHRRRRVATCLLAAAEACAVARGWPTLWAAGLRTQLGETLVRRLRWGRDRARPLTAVAPPMTPATETAGRLGDRAR